MDRPGWLEASVGSAYRSIYCMYLAQPHATSLDLHVKDYSVIVVDYKVLRTDLGLNICLLDNLRDLGSSALDDNFEWLMLTERTHCPRTQSVLQPKHCRRYH